MLKCQRFATLCHLACWLLILLLTLSQDGFAALHAACQEGHTQVVKLLLQAGASVEQKTEVRWSVCQDCVCDTEQCTYNTGPSYPLPLHTAWSQSMGGIVYPNVRFVECIAPSSMWCWHTKPLCSQTTMCPDFVTCSTNLYRLSTVTTNSASSLHLVSIANTDSLWYMTSDVVWHSHGEYCVHIRNSDSLLI